MNDVVRTKRLEIYNDDDNCVMSLDCWDDGKPFVRMYDGKGRERLVLSLNSENQPQVSLLGPEGNTIVGIGITDAMGSGFNIMDASGEIRIIAAVRADGTADLRKL